MFLFSICVFVFDLCFRFLFVFSFLICVFVFNLLIRFPNLFFCFQNLFSRFEFVFLF